MKLLFHKRASVRARGAEEIRSREIELTRVTPENLQFQDFGLNHVQWDVHTRSRSFWEPGSE
jgi:hypothetical protein